MVTVSDRSTPGIEHEPHSSADFDDMEYVDERGIRIFDSDWTCPNCGDRGELMFRPGSLNTCARCFWVIDGQYNDFVLEDWPLLYRQGQRLLAAEGMTWHGTPGSVGTQLRQLYDKPEEAAKAIEQLQDEEPVSSVATLGDFDE